MNPPVTRPCALCGTWRCAACGWKRLRARIWWARQSCIRCGSTAGTMKPTQHARFPWEDHLFGSERAPAACRSLWPS